MRNVLLLNASARGDASLGLRLAEEWVDSLTSAHPLLSVTRRDLAAQPLAPLSAGYATALTRRTPALDPVFVDSETLISELELNTCIRRNSFRKCKKGFVISFLIWCVIFFLVLVSVCLQRRH